MPYLAANTPYYGGVQSQSPVTVIKGAGTPPAIVNTDYIVARTHYLNTLTGQYFVLAGKAAGGVATWAFLGGSTGDLNTLTGDTGGVINPSSGNIGTKGTANQVTVTGSGSTLTWSLPVAITTPGSLTTTTTLIGGTGITATTGNITASAGNIAATLGSVSAGTTVTAGTGVTATTGNLTATNGNLALSTAGNKISIATGANSSLGVSGAMTAGTITISTTAVTANSLIFVQPAVLGTVTVPQALYVSAISAGTSFTVTSADATDTSTVQWWLIN